MLEDLRKTLHAPVLSACWLLIQSSAAVQLCLSTVPAAEQDSTWVRGRRKLLHLLVVTVLDLREEKPESIEQVLSHTQVSRPCTVHRSLKSIVNQLGRLQKESKGVCRRYLSC